MEERTKREIVTKAVGKIQRMKPYQLKGSVHAVKPKRVHLLMGIGNGQHRNLMALFGQGTGHLHYVQGTCRSGWNGGSR